MKKELLKKELLKLIYDFDDYHEYDSWDHEQLANRIIDILKKKPENKKGAKS